MKARNSQFASSVDPQAPDQMVQEENGGLGRFSSFRKNRYNQYHMPSSSDQRLPVNECPHRLLQVTGWGQDIRGTIFACLIRFVPQQLIFLQSVTSTRMVVAWHWLGVNSMKLKEDGTERVSTYIIQATFNVVIFSDAGANVTLSPKLLAYGDEVLSLTVRISYNAFIRATKRFSVNTKHSITIDEPARHNVYVRYVHNDT
ncbi:hypothetical protein EDD85DRAFT_787797 [Armillaria nabsnona]|nr:hypothetical protein EDD85DRAFT_787797 [Armillaria nabsnona]